MEREPARQYESTYLREQGQERKTGDPYLDLISHICDTVALTFALRARGEHPTEPQP